MLTLSEVQPDAATFSQVTVKEATQEASQITKQTLNAGSQDLVSVVEVVIESGDTLSEIAAEHGIKTSELMAVNGIENASRIYIGQTLKIPGQINPQTSSATEGTSVPHNPVSVVEVVVESGAVSYTHLTLPTIYSV